MKRQPIRVAVAFTGCLGAGLIMLAGCGVGGDVTSQPTEFVVWGDPAPSSDATQARVRDANNEEERYVLVGADGRVQFSTGSVCTDCRVEQARILVDEVATVAIRWGPDPAGSGERFPYLVSADRDANYIQLIDDGDGVAFQKTAQPFEEVAEELVVWGDSATNGVSTAVVRDVNDDLDSFVLVGTDEFVQFANGRICADCAVQDATITDGSGLEMNVRIGNGPDGTGDRAPFLVSADGFYVELMTDGDAVTFEESNDAFEPVDDPGDDLAEQVGTVDNPAPGDNPDDDLARVAGTITNTPPEGTQEGCAPGLLMFAPLTALGIVGLRVRRRMV